MVYMEEYWGYVATAFGAGGLTKVFDLFLSSKRSKRREDRNDTELITSQYQELLMVIKSERDAKQALISQQENAIRTMACELEELREQLRELKSSLSAMESLHLDLPLPQWVKDKGSKVISMNKAYEDVFLFPIGKSIEDYIGHNDIDVWGEEIGQEFMSNDAEVMRKRKPIHVIETIVNKKGVKKYWYIYKFPIWSNRSVIGTGGIAYRAVDKKPDIVPEGFEYY